MPVAGRAHGDGGGQAAAASMVDEVYATLQSSIVQARLGAGTPLSQNKVAARLGVSRTPVRDALLRLERDGLVERVPDVGYVVAGITPDEVDDLCDLIAVLDTYVYTRTASALDDDALAALSDLAAEMVRAAEADDLVAWLAADERWHDAVMTAADNRAVAATLSSARHRVQRFWVSQRAQDGRLVTCSLDHMALADAMAARDAARLGALVESHIDRMRRNVLARLDSAAPLLPVRDPFDVRPPGGPDA